MKNKKNLFMIIYIIYLLIKPLIWDNRELIVLLNSMNLSKSRVMLEYRNLRGGKL